jgi:uncharacterized protein
MNNTRSVVNSKSAQLLANNSEPFLLVINKDENVFDALISCAKQTKIASASFSGFGAVKNIEIGFFNETTKQYKNKSFNDGIYELVAMHGTITKLAGQYFIHIHAAISDADYRVYAGHLHRAEIAVVAEVTIIPFAHSIERELNPEFNLKLIKAD